MQNKNKSSRRVYITNFVQFQPKPARPYLYLQFPIS